MCINDLPIWLLWIKFPFYFLLLPSFIVLSILFFSDMTWLKVSCAWITFSKSVCNGGEWKETSPNQRLYSLFFYLLPTSSMAVCKCRFIFGSWKWYQIAVLPVLQDSFETTLIIWAGKALKIVTYTHKILKLVFILSYTYEESFG